MELSIVIIVCKRDAEGTAKTLQSLAGLSADVLLYDTSNTAISKQFAVQYNARFAEGEWEGYERVRFKAGKLAIYDWILMLHTGEMLDEELTASLRVFDRSRINKVYRIRFKNFFGSRWLCHGEWGGYYHIRLANRAGVDVTGGKINAQLFSQAGLVIQQLRGHILHSTIKDRNSLAEKMRKDALLAAMKYYRHGRRAGPIRVLISPLAAFIKHYFIKRGLLDGKDGFVCARMGAWYTFLKYNRLRELNQQLKRQL